MGDSLNNTIRILSLSLLVMSFSSCERKKIEEQKDLKKEQSETIPKQTRLEEKRRHPFFEAVSTQSANERKPSANLPSSTLDDTGVETLEPELPEYASAVLLELEAELVKAISEKASRAILNDLAEKYWIEGFEINTSLKGVDFSTLFYDSKKFVKELRSGGGDLNLSDDELKSSYAMFSIMALLSQSPTSDFDHFFRERMNASSIQIGDLLLARIASQVKPFKGSDTVDNIRMLEDMGNAKNPIYRALAVSSGNIYLKEEQKLFDFYSKFEEDPQFEVRAFVLDELAKLNSEAAFLEVDRIMKKSKGQNDPIHIHAKKLLENRER